MGAGIGFSRYAMKVTQANRNALKKIRDKYKKARRTGQIDFVNNHFPNSDPEVVKTISKEMDVIRRRRSLRNYIIVIGVFTIAILFTIFLMNN